MCAINLGTGCGTTVLELVDAFRQASGHDVPYVFGPRRDGDVPAYYAAADLARERLAWKAEYDLHRMCGDAWRWQSKSGGTPA